jgi:hypothetical protein
MGRKAARPSDSFEEICLHLLFSILVASGLRVERLRAVTDKILNTLKNSRRRWDPAEVYFLDRLAHVSMAPAGRLFHPRQATAPSPSFSRPCARQADPAGVS